MRIATTIAVLAVTTSAQQVTSTSEASSATETASVSSLGDDSTTATTSTSGPITHTVAVAKGGHSFSPDVTLAEVGDVIGKDDLSLL